MEQETGLTPNQITLFYSNSNIHPESEWHARRKALQDTTQTLGYKVVVDQWKPSLYFNQIRHLINAQLVENKKLRCVHCWILRLETTFRYAKEHQFDQVSSTMLSSTHMDREMIIRIGTRLGLKYQIPFYVPKIVACQNCVNGYYKQNYCGCVYSLAERLKEKYC